MVRSVMFTRMLKTLMLLSPLFILPSCAFELQMFEGAGCGYSKSNGLNIITGIDMCSPVSAGPSFSLVVLEHHGGMMRVAFYNNTGCNKDLNTFMFDIGVGECIYINNTDISFRITPFNI